MALPDLYASVSVSIEFPRYGYSHLFLLSPWVIFPLGFPYVSSQSFVQVVSDGLA